MKNRGQNIVELSIILGVVILGSVLALTLLGGNITTMFSKSNDSLKNYNPFQSSPVAETNGVLSSNPTAINGTNVNINSDGSANFNVGGQNVAMNSDVMNKLNGVFETTGAGGLTAEVMDAIKTLIADNASNYPAGQMPLEIKFGTGTREDHNEAYVGSAEANIVTLAVGDQVIIINKDQTYERNGIQYSCDATKAECTTTTLKGTIDSGSFNGTIVSDGDTDRMHFSVGADGTIQGTADKWDWDIAFTDSGQSIVK